MPEGEPPWVEPNPALPRTLVDSCLACNLIAITGATGSGKTRLLRALRERLSPQFQVKDTTMAPMTPIWNILSPKIVNLDHWESLWRCLILASLTTHYNEHLDAFEAPARQRIVTANGLLPKTLTRLPYFKHPYAVASSLANAPLGMPIEKYVLSQIWDEIEHALLSCPDDLAPAILIELDNLDDYFDNSPSVMAEIQAGLGLYLAKLENGPFGQRSGLRIHAALRQTTHSFIRRLKNKDLSGDRTSIEIRWTKAQIASLLESLLEGRQPKDEVLSVPLRGTQENAEQYLLRHTTLTPRTAIQMARALTDDSGAPITDPDELRTAVAAQAEIIASSTIHQVASDLRAFGSRMPTGMRATGDESRQEELKQRLVIEFERMGRDRLDRASLQNFVAAWDTLTRPYLTDTLWAYRLLGTYHHEEHTLRVARTVIEHTPRDRNDFMFHSCLMDLANIEPTMEAITIEFV